MPLKFKSGLPVTSGVASMVAARAINHAIEDIVSKYHNVVLNNTSQLRTQFQNYLKKEFQDSSNGGRVNFNDMSLNIIPTAYKTYGIFEDECE